MQLNVCWIFWSSALLRAWLSLDGQADTRDADASIAAVREVCAFLKPLACADSLVGTCCCDFGKCTGGCRA